MAGPPPYYIPPPPPPPPPGYGQAFGSKPTSGKAIASLVCGLVGLPAVFCYIGGLAGLIGVVLGILGLIETGREGPRGGRGMAIAGTIVSVLAVIAMGGWISFIALMSRQANDEMQREAASTLDRDQSLILERLKAYYEKNEQSLGPGGPVLAAASSRRRGHAPANYPATDERVVGALELHHLIDEEELGYGTNQGLGMGWELTITGKASATLRAKDWTDAVVREVTIQDIGQNRYAETTP